MHVLFCPFSAAVAFAAALGFGSSAGAAGDAERGAQVARACLACHSLTAGRHLTGPSLFAVVGRKAGSAEGFTRYSQALKRSGLTWDESHLDAWLKDPAALMPGNNMGFAGIPEATARADLIAYLEGVSAGRIAAPDVGLPDLKKADGASRVTSIDQCGDAYRVGTADGTSRTFWEFNLRFKTDGSIDGPAAGHPVIVGNGMRGDRAAVIFSRLNEISSYVRKRCP